jgi:putative transposase
LAAFTASRRGERPGPRVGFPRFKRKTATVASFRIRQKTRNGRGCIRVGQGSPRSVTLPRIGVLGVREDTRRLRRMLRTGRATILAATVTGRAGRWTLSVTVEAADLHPAVRHPSADGAPVGPWVGVDRGLFAYAVAATADGREVLREDDAPRPLRTAQARLRRLNRRVSRKRKGSANRREAAARLGRAHAQVRNVRQHFLHRVANALVQTHDRLAVEDLNITGMMRNHHLAGAIADAAWAELARIVDYKQRWRGGQVIPVDRWYPSTKTCSRCRSVAAAMPLSTRIFHRQQCGYQADRDLNAAINLAIWAEQHHAQVRDPEVRGPVTNAPRGAGRDPRPHAGRSRPHRRRNPNRPTRQTGTPEKGGVPSLPHEL